MDDERAAIETGKAIGLQPDELTRVQLELACGGQASGKWIGTDYNFEMSSYRKAATASL